MSGGWKCSANCSDEMRNVRLVSKARRKPVAKPCSRFPQPLPSLWVAMRYLRVKIDFVRF